MVASTNESLPELTDIPPSTAPMIFSPNAGATAQRPHSHRIQMLLRNPDGLDDLCSPNAADKTACFVRSTVLKGRAEQQLAAKEYFGPPATYIQVASGMVVASSPSSGDIRSDTYAALGHDWETIDLMACFNGVVE
ncbi:hypothetical protein B0H13DRAFT_2391418 [Mycena leptocephala]|nr:hypothetical protein B0H13DRAFT_2391418 [Mycena leptocephala]